MVLIRLVQAKGGGGGEEKRKTGRNNTYRMKPLVNMV